MNMKRWREPSQKGAARRAENNFKAPLKGEDCGNWEHSEGKVLGCLVIKEGFPTLCIFLSKGKFQVMGAEPEILC